MNKQDLRKEAIAYVQKRFRESVTEEEEAYALQVSDSWRCEISDHIQDAIRDLLADFAWENDIEDEYWYYEYFASLDDFYWEMSSTPRETSLDEIKGMVSKLHTDEENIRKCLLKRFSALLLCIYEENRINCDIAIGETCGLLSSFHVKSAFGNPSENKIYFEVDGVTDPIDSNYMEFGNPFFSIDELVEIAEGLEKIEQES